MEDHLEIARRRKLVRSLLIIIGALVMVALFSFGAGWAVGYSGGYDNGFSDGKVSEHQMIKGGAE